MAINSTSFTNTPQAGDDLYNLTEDQLLAMGNTGQMVTLDVMANDLGGNAKRLFSVDDGNGNPLNPTDLLNADGLVNGVSAWEATTGGNLVRINNGKIEIDISHSLAANGATAGIDSLGAEDSIHDTFVYAIRLGNGTLSWATVRINITGSNDAATISSQSKSLTEGDTVAAISTSGTLTISDVDSGQAHVVTQTDVAGAYGKFSIDADGHWAYVATSAHNELAANQVVTESFSVTSQDGTGHGTVTINITGTNDGPMITSGATGSVAENAATGTVVYDASASDPDTGDTVSFSLGGADAAAFSIDADTGEVRLNASADFEAKSSYQIDVIGTDSGNLTNTKAVTISVVDVNEAPTITSGATGSVAENAATSTVIYTVAATDVDAGANGQVSYSLSGADAALLSIDAAGQVTLNDSANFEAKSSYSFNVVATDGGTPGLTDTKAVTVGVVDVNEAPTITSGATGSVAENAATSTVIYTVAATDVDAGANGQVSYSLSGADAALLSIDAAGQVTLNDSANFEAKSSYSFNVVATDGGTPGLTDTKAVTVGVVDVNEAPTITSGATGSVDENAATSTVIYTVAATDVDAGANGQVSYSLSGADAALLSIDAAGQVTLNDSANFEAKSSYSFNVVATDGGTPGLTDTKAVTVGVVDVNEAPTITSGATGSVDENAATSTVIYTVAATDVDAGANGQVSYSLSGADAALLSIDAAGQVTLNDSANFEAKSSYSFNVVATDGGTPGLTDTKAVTVGVVDVNEAPTITSGATGSVAENAATSTVIYTVAATDVDAGANGQVSYSLSGADAALLSIDAAGQVTLNDSANFEAKSSYSFNVVATDGGTPGLTDTKAVTVGVVDVNEAPTITSGATGSVAENAATSTVIYTVAATDVDAGANGQVSYSLSGADAALLSINAAGQVTLNDSANFEAKSSYSFNVVATDGGTPGLTDTKAVTVGVVDVNEAPTITSGAIGSVDENAATSTVVYTVAATDVDAGANGQVSYSLSGADAALLSINAAGQVTLNDSANFEAKSSYSFNVVATDGGTPGLTDTKAVTVGVIDVNEFAVTKPVDSDAAANAMNENVAIGTLVGITASASDADATNNGVTYSLSSNPGGLFAINAATGVVTTAAAIDREALGASASVTVRATSADGSTADQVFSIAVNDVNEFNVTTPTDTNAAANAVNENVAIGTLVGITASASDADATNNGVTYSLSSNPGGLFAINAATGVVTTAAAIDREALGASASVTVRATSADGSTADQVFSIAVNDVNEFNVTTPTDTNAAANAVNENVAIGTLVGITASASDADATNNGMTYSLSSNPGGLFAINAATGVVTTAAAIDREALGASASITVRATSADGSTADQAFSIAINGVDEFAPVITSNGGGTTAAVSVAENATTVTTVTATDADQPAATLVYSIAGGADAAKFAINNSTGTLSFVSAPNFELPADSGTNNVYDVTVQVSDGTLTDTQAIAVTVTPLDEFAPVITSNGGGATAAVSVAENSTVVTTVTATDADLPAPTFVYSIAGGADAAKFTINASTGALAFAAAPDFETPTDSGGNNVYDVTVQVSDGTLTDTQAIAVTVTDVAESTGNDTYHFGLAAGNNTILDAGGTDAIVFDGTPVTSLNFQHVGNDLVIDANSTHITVTNHYAGTGNAVESISFSGGGTVYGYALGTGSYNLATSASGGNGDDVVAGSSAADSLDGANGSDLLFGNASSDTLVGGGAADLLVGGLGNDTLTGGNGSDTFVFNTAPNNSTNVDHITDFAANGGNADSIYLSTAFFANIGVSGGTLAAADWATVDSTVTPVTSQSVDANVNIIYDVHTGALYYDSNGGNNLNNAVQFAVLDNFASLGANFDNNDIKVGP